jgi:hypothetical protein
MDKLYEIYIWLLCLAFDCWFVKNEATPTGDKDSPEVAPAAGPSIPEVTGTLSERTEKPRDLSFGEGSLITFNLSEMMPQRKVRRSLLKRRKEDLPIAK